MGIDDEKLNASNISTYSNKMYNKLVHVRLNMCGVQTFKFLNLIFQKRS